jgi:hypothetical protein
MSKNTEHRYNMFAVEIKTKHPCPSIDKTCMCVGQHAVALSALIRLRREQERARTPASHLQQHHQKKEEALLHARLIFALLQTLVFVKTTAPRLLSFSCTYLARACLYTNPTFPSLHPWSSIGTMKYATPHQPMPNGCPYPPSYANTTRAGSANSYAAR